MSTRKPIRKAKDNKLIIPISKGSNIIKRG
jgi:hypothetical protein